MTDRDELDRLRSEREEALIERARLWGERERRVAAERELEHARSVMRQMQSSFSWRATGPLRAAKGQAGTARTQLRRVRGRLGR